MARAYDKFGKSLTIGGKVREKLYDTAGRMIQVKRVSVAVRSRERRGGAGSVIQIHPQKQKQAYKRA